MSNINDNPYLPPTKEFIRNSLTYGLLQDEQEQEDVNAQLDLTPILGLENDDFIRQLYLRALGRLPDAPAIEHWKSALNNGAKKEAVIYMVCTSQEFAARKPVSYLDEYGRAYSKYRFLSRLKRLPILGHLWALMTLPRRMEGSVASLESAERVRYEAITTALEAINQRIDLRTRILETALTDVNQRVEILERGLTGVHQRVEMLETAVTSVNQKSDQNAILITRLHEKIDALHITVDSLNLRRVSNKSSKQVDDSMEVLISNGLIDEESYLEKSLENEKMNVFDFKNKYDEDGWYFLFEKLFRGSEEEITRRQSFYIGYVQACHRLLSLKNKVGYVLDFGSGKGEFLNLLSQSGIPGKGVDTNCLNTEYVIKKGLDAICEDGIRYLESLNDDELYGITTFQVAEHLEFDTLKRFLHLAYQKIMPGGILIVETVNPSCIYSMQYFYLDPTHIRPYPPETLRFYSEWLGFANIKIAYYIPVQREAPRNDTSNYMGYALIGYKPEQVDQMPSP